MKYSSSMLSRRLAELKSSIQVVQKNSTVAKIQDYKLRDIYLNPSSQHNKSVMNSKRSFVIRCTIWNNTCYIWQEAMNPTKVKILMNTYYMRDKYGKILSRNVTQLQKLTRNSMRTLSIV